MILLGAVVFRGQKPGIIQLSSSVPIEKVNMVFAND